MKLTEEERKAFQVDASAVKTSWEERIKVLPAPLTMFTHLRFNNSEEMLPRVDEPKKKKTSEARNEEGPPDDEDPEEGVEGGNQGGSGGGGLGGDDDQSDQGNGEIALQDKGSGNVLDDTTEAWTQYMPKQQQMFQRFFMVLLPKVWFFGFVCLLPSSCVTCCLISCLLFLLSDQSAME